LLDKGMTEAIIETRNLTRDFKKTRAVDGLNLSIAAHWELAW